MAISIIGGKLVSAIKDYNDAMQEIKNLTKNEEIMYLWDFTLYEITEEICIWDAWRADNGTRWTDSDNDIVDIIAKYVEEGSYLDMQEDFVPFYRLYFKNKTYEEYPAKIIYPNCPIED